MVTARYVFNAGKLTDVKGALRVDDGTFGSQPTQRSSPAAKVSQVLHRFGIGLNRPTGRHQHGQLDQRRGRSPSLPLYALENPLFILKSKRPHAIDIIDRQEKVDRGERLVVLRSSGLARRYAALGMIPEDDPTRPPVRFSISYGTMEN